MSNLRSTLRLATAALLLCACTGGDGPTGPPDHLTETYTLRS